VHIQAKATPSASPPDLEAFFTLLSEPATPDHPDRVAINIEGISGDDMETGGEIYFSFDHDRQADVGAWLAEKGFTKIEFMDAEQGHFFQAVIEDAPGQLLGAIRDATTQNLAAGKIIKSIVVGRETQAPNRLYVNITFQEVKTG
jgi:hypothetical protein